MAELEKRMTLRIIHGKKGLVWPACVSVRNRTKQLKDCIITRIETIDFNVKV